MTDAEIYAALESINLDALEGEDLEIADRARSNALEGGADEKSADRRARFAVLHNRVTSPVDAEKIMAIYEAESDL